MSDEAKPVLMVMGTHHSRMDYLASEFKERFGQVNCTGFIQPYSIDPDNQIHNEDLDLSDVGDDPLDALHIWIVDGDSFVSVKSHKSMPGRYRVTIGCRPRVNRFERVPSYTSVFDLACDVLYDMQDSESSMASFKFWSNYYRKKLGVRVAKILRLSGPTSKTVVVCDVDTNQYEKL